MQHLEESVERVVAGTQKTSRVISPFEKKIVAYHEAGHALVGYLLPHTDPVHKVSIIPRGRAGGYTLMFPGRRSLLHDQNRVARSGQHPAWGAGGRETGAK
jgi:ATP-dependent Zn protease